MKTERRLVGPELARAMLDRNIAHNRSVRTDAVRRYESDMASGKWKENAAAIVFLEDGRLADGQHRLHAIIRSGMTIPMNIVSGMSEDALSTIDIGLSRTSGDYIKMRGHGYANESATVAKLLLQYRSDKWSTSDGLSKTSITEAATELSSFVGEYNALASQIYATCKLLKTSSLSFGRLATEAGYSKHHIVAFLHNLATGASLEYGDPRLALRNAAMNRAQVGNAARRAHLFGLIVVFNEFNDGVRRKLLRLSSLLDAAKPSIKPHASVYDRF